MRIALTGSPYSGKTTTLDALKKVVTNYTIIDESALPLIQQLSGMCGFDKSKQWRKQFDMAWQNLVVARQLHLEERAGGANFIVDSTPIDSLVFAYVSGAVNQELRDACRQVTYDKVFFLEMIQPFDPRTETGRLQTEEDCKDIGATQLLMYEMYKMPPIRIPFMPVEQRVAKVLELSGLALCQ